MEPLPETFKTHFATSCCSYGPIASIVEDNPIAIEDSCKGKCGEMFKPVLVKVTLQAQRKKLQHCTMRKKVNKSKPKI